MRRWLFSIAGLLLGAGSLLAQANTTPGTAADFAWGQNLLTGDNGTTSQFWFFGTVAPRRSYCVESGQGQQSVIPDQDVHTILTVYAGDTTTVVVSNDDATTEEPKAHGFSRACWTSLSFVDQYIKVIPNNPSNPGPFISLRFVETTLFCPWFFIGGDYNAFSLIKNTSLTSIAGVIVTWYGLNGTQAGTTTITIPGNGTAIVNARDFVNPTAFTNGSVVIAHPGSPQQLTASTTTLSGTTGLGFDALFSQRRQW